MFLDAVKALLTHANDLATDPVSYARGVTDVSEIAQALLRQPSSEGRPDQRLRGASPDPRRVGRVAAENLRLVGEFLERSGSAYAARGDARLDVLQVLEDSAAQVSSATRTVEDQLEQVLPPPIAGQ